MEMIDFLPIVKAYPAVGKAYGEVAHLVGVQFRHTDPLSLGAGVPSASAVAEASDHRPSVLGDA
jgi:hypothetical protein